MSQSSSNKKVNEGIKRVQYGIIHRLPTESPGIAAARRIKQKNEIENRLKEGEVLEDIQRDMGLFFEQEANSVSEKNEAIENRQDRELKRNREVLHEEDDIRIFFEDNANKKGQITVEGKLIIGNMKILKSTLIETLKPLEELEIVLKNVRQIDLSCLQLIHIAKKTKTKKVWVSAHLNDDIEKLLINTGFQQILNN